MWKELGETGAGRNQACKAQYGETIFGPQQPKRAIEAVADTLYGRGFEVKAGIYVKKDGAVAKGFSIAGIETS